MSRDPDEGEWHVTTDRQRIVAWAEQHDGVPVRTDAPESGVPVDVVSEPDSSPGEEIDWETFFDRFEAERLAFKYRTGGGGGRQTGEVVRRESLDDREAADEKTDPPDDVPSEQIAASDTGEGEPVIFDQADSKGEHRQEGSPGKRSDRGTQGTPGPKADAEKRSEDPADGDTAVSESARDAEERAIVLDEVSEGSGGFNSDPGDEYLVFQNAGEQPVDLGGWSVENDDGRSYVFPAEFVLPPNERVTLHSGRGDDTDADLYWGAEESVWDPTGGTVELRTRGGERVISEPIRNG